MRPSRVLAPLAAAGLALALAGCVHSPSDDASSTSTPHGTRTPSASATSTAAPSGTPSPSASATPAPGGRGSSAAIGKNCAQVVSNDAVYQFNPIYSPKSPAAPASGTEVARIAASGGLSCQWLNTSSGTTIDLGAAKYSASGLKSVQSQFSGGTAVSSWGADSAHFGVSGGIGVATATVGGTWITCSSADFGSASDADAFMSSAVAALR